MNKKISVRKLNGILKFRELKQTNQIIETVILQKSSKINSRSHFE